MTDSIPENERGEFVPRPPPITSTADFVVVVFAVTITVILIGFAITTMIGGLLGEDVKAYVAMLTDILGTILGALVGFIAGKGTAQAERK